MERSGERGDGSGERRRKIIINRRERECVCGERRYEIGLRREREREETGEGILYRREGQWQISARFAPSLAKEPGAQGKVNVNAAG